MAEGMCRLFAVSRRGAAKIYSVTILAVRVRGRPASTITDAVIARHAGSTAAHARDNEKTTSTRMADNEQH